jgi:serine/threonine protein kinase/WD40 repeat protein
MNAPTINSGSIATSGERDPLEQLTDEFLQRLRSGEQPNVAEYAERFPALASQIREIFPALLILEQAGPQGTAGSFGLLGDPNSPQRTPPTIGDYQLVREIGRGAMGVVYEAQQRSLDRRVALKILPWHASSDNVAVERFRREAKAAARLHHTNIVPVFEVGRAGEICFYTMQFIQGQSLDKVIVELRRLERNRKLDVVGELPTERAPSLQSLALSLQDGQFAQEPAGDLLVAPLAAPETIRLAAGSTVADKSHVSLADSGKEHYYRSVAHMGRQIADALAYAHSRGVIHRDIKPSNVLLDAAGVAWVTDFGLAKIEDAGLTQAGDILGTLRYMAPERFQGQCDATADVYSLGVTLYELLVLRPPHAGEQRAELIAQITQRDPLPLRVIDAGVPRDLELIVLKALERESQHRYPTAAAVAEDLRRFLADEPILGRRISAWERFARWVRHNRMLAASIIGSAVLLVLLVVATGLAGASFRALAIQEHDERIDTTKHLYRSLRGEAKATRLARREGFRGQVWSLLDEARRLDSEVVDREELRAEAIQSLGDFVGLKPQDLQGFPAEVRALAISPDSQAIAVGLASGAIQWHEATTGNVVSKRSEHFAAVTRLAFTPEGVLLSADARGVVRSWQRKQDEVWESTELSDVRAPLLAVHAGSPEQRLIAYMPEHSSTLVTIDDLSTKRRISIDPGCVIGAAAFNNEGTWLAGVAGNDIFVWQTANGGLIKRANSNLGPLTGVTFSRDGQLLLCTGEQGLAVFDLPELRQQTFTRTEQLAAGAFTRDGRQVAIASEGRRVTLWSVFGNREVAALTHPGWKPLHTIAFSDDERLLASADGDSVRIWNLAGTPERLNLAGHTSGVTSIGFNPDGSKLYSTSKDHKIALWDAKTGDRLAITGLAGIIQTADFSSDGKLLAAGDSAGKLAIFDAETLSPVLDVPHSLGGFSSVRFSRDGKYFAAAGVKGLIVWRLKPEPHDEDGKPRLALEEAKRIDDANCGGITISPDSQFLAWLNGQGRVGALVLDQLAQWPCNAPRSLPGGHNLAFHGDSRHLLLVDTNDQLVQWDVLGDRATAVIGERGNIRGSNLTAGPNGRWVAVNAEPLRLSVWDLGEKKQAFLFREERSAVSATAWSTAGDRLAFGAQDGQVAIWDLSAVRRELASIELDWPNEAFELPKEAVAASPLQALTEALEREPKNCMLLLRRASLHLEKGDTDRALADLSQALEADEKNEAAWVGRSNLYARLGKWREAAADAVKAVEQNPEPVRNWVAAALLLARADDAAQYQRHCGKMVERFGETSDPQIAASVVRAALLRPAAVETSRLPRQVVETAAAGFGPSPVSRADAYTTLALLELRAGKPESALGFIRRAQSDPAYSKTPAVQSLSFLVQAVAEHTLGKRGVARESLKASRDFASGIPSEAPRGDFVISNRTRMVLQILLPEAERNLR